MVLISIISTVAHMDASGRYSPAARERERERERDARVPVAHSRGKGPQKVSPSGCSGHLGAKRLKIAAKHMPQESASIQYLLRFLIPKAIEGMVFGYLDPLGTIPVIQ